MITNRFARLRISSLIALIFWSFMGLLPAEQYGKFTYRETTAAAPRVTWLGEWSVDGAFWMHAGVRYQTLEAHSGHRLAEARVSMNRETMTRLSREAGSMWKRSGSAMAVRW